MKLIIGLIVGFVWGALWAVGSGEAGFTNRMVDPRSEWI